MFQSWVDGKELIWEVTPMTEAEWLACDKPFPCIDIAKEFGTTRKLRLLMVGMVGRLKDVFSEERGRVFLMLSEWAED
jgi:hypothetical protein